MESIVHIELEPGRILELCEAHFKKLRNFLGTTVVTAQFEYNPPPSPDFQHPLVLPTYISPSSWLQDCCQHEYDYGTAVPVCRKCGKPAPPSGTAHTICTHYRFELVQ